MNTSTPDNRPDPEQEPAEDGSQGTAPAAAGPAAGTGEPEAAADAAPVPVEEGEDAHEEAEAERELAALDATRSGAAGVLPGAAAIVGLGLALASVTGTWIGTLMAERETVIGQIGAQSKSAADQIAAVYGTPWHTTALFNGIFAVAALLVVGAVLIWRAATPDAVVAPWVRAVAWGALALAVIGLLIAGAMWFDVFTSLPTVPAAPAAPGTAG